MKIALKSVGSNQTTLTVGDVVVFFSYETPVAAFVTGLGWIRTDKKYSKTTTKHINNWCGRSASIVPQAHINSLLENR